VKLVTRNVNSLKARLRRVLEFLGEHAPDVLCMQETKTYTWWDYRQGHLHRGLGLRIDLVLLSAALAPGLERVGIERNHRKGSPKPSDHAPLVATAAAP
jgi:exodeoxyribonuclease-3